MRAKRVLGLFLLAAWLPALTAVAHAERPARTYRLTEDEQKLDCPRLASAVQTQFEQIKTLQRKARKEEAAPADNIARWIARASGAPGAGIAALEEVAYVRAKADAFNAALKAKKCTPVDIDPELAKTSQPGAARTGAAGLGAAGLGAAGLGASRQGAPGLEAARPGAAIADRCGVRNELALSDCVEDIVQWRCRASAKDANTYVACMDAVARRTIVASGFVPARVSLFGPDCTGDSFKVGACSVFTNGRPGTGTQWCQRQSEDEIKVCDSTQKNCHAEHCALGSCGRLCWPPADGDAPPPAAHAEPRHQRRAAHN